MTREKRLEVYECEGVLGLVENLPLALAFTLRGYGGGRCSTCELTLNEPNLMGGISAAVGTLIEMLVLLCWRT